MPLAGNLPAVICVQYQMLLTETMLTEKVVQKRDDTVGTFSRAASFIYQIIDLAWQSSSTYSKQSTSAGDFKENRSRLHGIIRIEYLKYEMRLICPFLQGSESVTCTTFFITTPWQRINLKLESRILNHSTC